jgi:hypothetical protein
LRAGEALSMNLGAVEMASSFASVAKTFSRGAGAVGAALSLVDLGVQVAKAVKTGEVTPEMMERMAKDVIGIASGIAAFAGMATLAGALSAVLATWEVSKALIAEMEGLQAVIIQGEMVETLEGLLADASAIATLHDQALLSACIGSGANEVEERLAYAKASDLIAADMQGPAASLLMKANGSRCDPIRDAINMVFAMHGEQAASGGFHVANLFATDLMMELEMLATDLPEHAEREAQKA